MSASCSVHAEVKPRFHKLPKTHLIKATERLSLDFKSPIAGCTRNRYMLTVVDGYSRFPFAFSCSSMDANTVITCLSELIAMFGISSTPFHATPSYARVRMANGREASVSHRDVAPIRDGRECNRTDLTESDDDFVSCDCASSSVRNQASEPESPDFAVSEASDNNSFSVADDFVPPSPEPTGPRRSTRISRPPERFTYDRIHIRSRQILRLISFGGDHCDNFNLYANEFGVCLKLT